MICENLKFWASEYDRISAGVAGIKREIRSGAPASEERGWKISSGEDLLSGLKPMKRAYQRMRTFELIDKGALETMDLNNEIRILRDEYNSIRNTMNSGSVVNSGQVERLNVILDEIELLQGQQDRQGQTSKRAAVRPDVGFSLTPKNGPFKNFGEQLKSIIRAGIPGEQVDPKLYQVRAATGLSEGIPSDSGFLIQQDFSNALLLGAEAQSNLKPLCAHFPISGPANSIALNAFDETSRVTGSRWGGVRAYWIAEAQEKIASKPKFRQLQLNLRKLVCLCYVTDEALEDAQNLQQIVTQALTAEIAYQADLAILEGTGAGQPLGILNSPSLVSVTRSTANNVSFTDIVNMWSRLLQGSHKNSVWVMNSDVLPELYAMTVGNAPVYLPANSVAGNPFPTLMGRPVILAEQCKSLGTKGDIYLASFADGYVWVDKGAVKTDISMHLRFLQDESILRLVYRCDGQVILNSTITPASNSANTQSHFICLSA